MARTAAQQVALKKAQAASAAKRKVKGAVTPRPMSDAAIDAQHRRNINKINGKGFDQDGTRNELNRYYKHIADNEKIRAATGVKRRRAK